MSKVKVNANLGEGAYNKCFKGTYTRGDPKMTRLFSINIKVNKLLSKIYTIAFRLLFSVGSYRFC